MFRCENLHQLPARIIFEHDAVADIRSVEGADGKWVHKTKQVVLKDFVDPHAGDCKM